MSQKRVTNFSIIFLTLVSFSLFGSPPSYSCPGYLFSNQFLRMPSEAFSRSSMHLFSLVKKNEDFQWQRLPLQIDPLDEGGRLAFFEDEQWRDEPIGADDRFSFRVEGFGARRPSGLSWPCQGGSYFELRDAVNQSKYAYLVSCLEPPKDKVLDHDKEHAVAHEEDNGVVSSPRFSYRYQKRNHLMFDDVILKRDDPDKNILVARNSRQEIRADLRNFFTMNFTDRDVRSELQDTRSGLVGLVGRLSFYLRILFFRIDLRLYTAVTFYEDSVHVPMTLSMPMSPQRMVHPGSGVYLSWESDPSAVTWQYGKDLMPVLAPAKVLKGTESLAEIGLPFCKGNWCRYQVSGQANDKSWSMDFTLHKSVVELGFFPMFVSDTALMKQDLGWRKRARDNNDRVGIYMETSGLPEGEHSYDFWIKVGDSQMLSDRACPHPIKYSGRRR